MLELRLVKWRVADDLRALESYLDVGTLYNQSGELAFVYRKPNNPSRDPSRTWVVLWERFDKWPSKIWVASNRWSRSIDNEEELLQLISAPEPP